MKFFKRRKPEIQKPSLPLLQTERLVMRCFDENDAIDVFNYAQSEIVGPMAGWAPHRSIEETRKIIRMFINGGEVWAIVEKKTGHVIGSIGLHVDSMRSIAGVKELGYALGERFWNQGFATEASREMLRYAFEELNTPVVAIAHFPSNEQSKRVIEKLGFTCEGVVRHAVRLPDGSITDSVIYSLLKAEYEKQRNAAQK